MGKVQNKHKVLGVLLPLASELFPFETQDSHPSILIPIAFYCLFPIPSQALRKNKDYSAIL